MTDTAGRLLRLLPLLLDEDSAIDQVLPPRLRRRVEALTVATVPLVPAEPSIEPNDLALVALTCQQSERLRSVTGTARGRTAAATSSRTAWSTPAGGGT